MNSLGTWELFYWQDYPTGSYPALLAEYESPTELSITNTLTSGTLIATINGTNIYAPTYTNGDNLSYGGN